MAKQPVKYHVVDAFTDTAFRGSPAAVCFLEEERDKQWLQAVAAEFNLPTTGYLIRSEPLDSPVHRFRLRWFTPVAEVKICGHATLAAAHTLFTTGLVDSNIVEFVTMSGILIARKVPEKTSDDSSIQNGESQESFFIELDFPTISLTDFGSTEVSLVSKALNGASVIDIKRTTSEDDLIVILPSGEAVAELRPNFDLVRKCPGRGIIVSGVAPQGSRFDYYSRFFCPKFTVNEDHVCGSANCALAPYWSKKLGKCDFVAYAASARSGILNIQFDEQKQRVLLREKAIATMEGSLFA